ncbi:MAG: hypothetical protein HKO65_10640 [Gemmatimonadetes bacterium]|nr:hypothetical protein [Gemmatimonadota bacterium]NNM05550.1 hypothetical protein [Gemmatimonadota bacterium]
MRFGISIGAALAIGISAGCAAEGRPDAGDPGIRADSGGVVQWTYTANPLADKVVLPRRPVATIGFETESNTYQHDRVVAAKLLAGGDIALAVGRAGEIRRYTEFGELKWTTGPHRGQSNDFSSTRWLQGAGDSIVAYDPRRARLSVLGPQGSSFRQSHIEPDARASFADAVGLLGGGEVLVELFDNPEVADGHFRPPRDLAVMTSAGALGPTLFRAPGPEIQFVAEGKGYVITRPVFGRTTYAVVEEVGFAVVDTERYEIRRYGADGVLRQILRRSVGREVTESVIKEAFRNRLRRTPWHRRKEGEEVLRNRLYHTELPAIGRLLSGGDGVLWASDFRTSPQSPEIWFSYGFDGEIEGVLELPPYQSLVDIDDRRALVRQDTGPRSEELLVYTFSLPAR